jgi:hypothetical protein
MISFRGSLRMCLGCDMRKDYNGLGAALRENTPRDLHYPRNKHAALPIVGKIVSTNITTEAVPFDRVPPSIDFPNAIFVKGKYISRVGRYLCDDSRLRAEAVSQL